MIRKLYLFLWRCKIPVLFLVTGTKFPIKFTIPVTDFLYIIKFITSWPRRISIFLRRTLFFWTYLPRRRHRILIISRRIKRFPGPQQLFIKNLCFSPTRMLSLICKGQRSSRFFIDWRHHPIIYHLATRFRANISFPKFPAPLPRSIFRP